MPERRHSLAKEEKLAPFHIMAIPRPPTTAMAGVALKMNLPADHAMYVATMTQIPRSKWLWRSLLAPRQIRTRAHPTAINATIGP